MSNEKNNAGAEGAAPRTRAAEREGVTNAVAPLKVHLLDIGRGSGHQYGDCALCQFGGVSVLIDGGHRGDDELVLRQLRRLLGQTSPVRVSLIIVTHPHDDHIGCLPSLVAQGELEADWALVADPQYRWGEGDDTDNDFADFDAGTRGLAEAVLEHDRSAWEDEDLADFVTRVANLETRYRRMLRQLEEAGTRVVRQGTDAAGGAALVEALAERGVGLEVIGPSLEQLRECRRLIREGQRNLFSSFTDFDLTSASGMASAYRSLTVGVAGFAPPNRGAINLQSLVTRFEYDGRRVLFAGDMQFADPQVESPMLIRGVSEMRRRISEDAPYSFVKLSHHGSDNAFSREILDEYGDTTLYGICCGDHPGHHPHPEVLELLDENRRRIDWVRSDRNGLVTITFGSGRPRIELSRGRKDDETPNMGTDTDGPEGFTTSAAPPPTATATFGGDSPDGSTYQFNAKLPPHASRLSVTLDLASSPQAAAATGAQAVTSFADVEFDASNAVVHRAGEIPPGELTPNSADDVDSEPGSAEFLFADANCNVPWRVARSLLTLRDMINARAPRRNKASDGTIGDARHCRRTSDHNPWVRDGRTGVVTALDITDDPRGGCDANTIAEAIRASRDPRVKYIIWKRHIANSAAVGGSPPWAWREYGGENPHTRHVHISVKPDKASYDSVAEWPI